MEGQPVKDGQMTKGQMVHEGTEGQMAHDGAEMICLMMALEEKVSQQRGMSQSSAFLVLRDGPCLVCLLHA